MDPVAKAQALERSATEQRQRIYARLQAEAPDVADFLAGINAAFGRADAVAIRFSDGEVYRRGRFVKAQEFDDFAKRCPQPLLKMAFKGRCNGRRGTK